MINGAVKKAANFITMNAFLSLMVWISIFTPMMTVEKPTELLPFVVLFFVYVYLHSYITYKAVPLFRGRKYLWGFIALFCFFWFTGRFLLVQAIQMSVVGTMLMTALVHAVVICTMYLIRDVTYEIKFIKSTLSPHLINIIQIIIGVMIAELIGGALLTGMTEPAVFVSVGKVLYDLFMSNPIIYWFIAMSAGGISLLITKVISYSVR